MRTKKTFSTITIVLFIGIILSCSLNPTEDDLKPIVVNFPDPNFESLVREVLEIPEREITNHDLWSIKQLSGINRNIFNISGIEHCSGLSILNLRQNYINNIEPLTGLVLLDHIDLQNNQISNIEPLVDNPGLGIGDDDLYLLNNPLSNISILWYKPLIQARGVNVYSNAIPSLTGILNIIDPNFEIVLREHLNKPDGDITISELATITTLNAQNRNIITIYGIEFCLNLKILNIDKNFISDLHPLSNLTQLTKLNANNNTLTDIGPLGGLNKLVNLFLSNNAFNDISPLSSLINLKYLALNGNPIDDFEPISRIDSLNGLELMNLEQFDINLIKEISNLKTLYLTNTLIRNLDSISNIASLQILIMNNCGLSNIDSLANLSNLRKLFLKNNSIYDISPISELYELYELELGNNYISDILPLVNNLGLSGPDDYVLLKNNPLSETSINTYIPQLENRGVHVIY